MSKRGDAEGGGPRARPSRTPLPPVWGLGAPGPGPSRHRGSRCTITAAGVTGVQACPALLRLGGQRRGRRRRRRPPEGRPAAAGSTQDRGSGRSDRRRSRRGKGGPGLGTVSRADRARYGAGTAGRAVRGKEGPGGVGTRQVSWVAPRGSTDLPKGSTHERPVHPKSGPRGPVRGPERL